MRVIVFLRPTNRYGTKGAYTAFRKLLTSSGFILLQPEVFMASVPTRRAVEHLLTCLQEKAPETGAVCALTLTERQYANINYLVGAPSYQDVLVGSSPSISL